MPVSRPLVIYHGNCVDGFGAAWCFWHRYGSTADFVAGVYDQPPPDVTGRNVYLVDFSYRRPVVAAMIERAACVTLIDHHKSAIEDLAGLPGLNMCCSLDMSGATLAWLHLFPNEPQPLLLSHIEDRDLWRFKLPMTRELQSNLESFGYSFEAYDRLMAMDERELVAFGEHGAAIQRKHARDVAQMLSVTRRRMVIGGIDVPVAGMPFTMVSDAANIMATGEPFAACYWDTPEARIFGLRSKAGSGLDVSQVAAAYGGGGHQHSAGFRVPRDHDLARA